MEVAQMKYALVPLMAWLMAGTLKFIVNFIRFRGQAVRLIGNGGFPSNHTTIMSSTVFLIGLSEGVNTPMFGLGLAILFIIVIDAMGIRQAVGKQARVINHHLLRENNQEPLLRERQGHTPVEVLGGLVVGLIVATIMNRI